MGGRIYIYVGIFGTKRDELVPSVHLSFLDKLHQPRGDLLLVQSMKYDTCIFCEYGDVTTLLANPNS